MLPSLAAVTASVTVLFAFSQPALAEDVKKPESPVCDPVATAKWVTSLYTLKEGKLTFFAENPNALHGQIPLPAKAKASPSDYLPNRAIIIDQEGLLSVEYDHRAGVQEFLFRTPIIDNSARVDEDFVPYAKDVALKEDPTILRKLGEELSSYFTALAKKGPTLHRVEGIHGGLTHYYIWKVGASRVILTAYGRNDEHGVKLSVCSEEDKNGLKEIADVWTVISEGSSLMEERLFEGWNEPLNDSISVVPPSVIAGKAIDGKVIELTAPCRVSKLPTNAYVRVNGLDFEVKLPPVYQGKVEAGWHGWIGLVGTCRYAPKGGIATGERSDGDIEVDKILFLDQEDGHTESLKIR